MKSAPHHYGVILHGCVEMGTPQELPDAEAVAEHFRAAAGNHSLDIEDDLPIYIRVEDGKLAEISLFDRSEICPEDAL